MDHNQYDEAYKAMGSKGAGLLKNKVAKWMAKALQKGGATVIKALFVAIKGAFLMLLPALKLIGITLLLFMFLYATVFWLPTFITQSISEKIDTLTDGIKGVFQRDDGTVEDYHAVFAWGENDKDYNFDQDLELYKQYRELTDDIDPDLKEAIRDNANVSETKELLDDMREQAKRYKLSWGLLAAIDRVMGDPAIHEEITDMGNRKPEPEKHYAALKQNYAEWDHFEESYYSYSEVYVCVMARGPDGDMTEECDWEVEEETRKKPRLLLKVTETFANDFAHTWETFYVVVTSSRVTISNTTKDEVVLSVTRGTPTDNVPEKYHHYLNRMESAYKAETAPDATVRNIRYEDHFAEQTGVAAKGEHLARLTVLLQEYGIQNDMEIDFVLQLAHTFDPAFYYERAEVYRAGSTRINTSVIHWFGEAGQFHYPLPRQYNHVSSPFGTRIHPILLTKRFHTGIDLPAPAGVDVYSALNGKVIHAGLMGGYGKTVVVDHNEYKTLYAHLTRIDAFVGKEVEGGDLIGGVGSTGMSTGNHLHFEVMLIKDGQSTHVDPLKFYSIH